MSTRNPYVKLNLGFDPATAGAKPSRRRTLAGGTIISDYSNAMGERQLVVEMPQAPRAAKAKTVKVRAAKPKPGASAGPTTTRFPQSAQGAAAAQEAGDGNAQV